MVERERHDDGNAARAGGWPAAGAALLVGAIAGAGWFAATTPTQRPAPVAVVPEPAAQPARQRDITEVMRVDAPSAAAGDDFPDTSASLKPGDVEMCGVGVARGTDVAAVQALQRRANVGDDDALGQRIVAALRASADPLTQVAALAVVRDVAALVAKAVATTDPDVYTFAMQACGFGQSTDAHCRMLSADRLAQLDASNAVPWLYAAADAVSRKDSQAEEAALYRASLAREFKHRQYAFGSLAWQALPRDWPLPERVRALVWITGVQAAFTLPAYSPAVRYCAKDQMADANRQQLCDRLAHGLTDKGSILIDYAIGRRVGANVGWSEDTVERHAARLEAMLKSSSEQIADVPGGPGSCLAMRAVLRHARSFGYPGERFFAEAHVASSGVTDAELLQRYRIAQQQREAEKLASAARAASAPAESTSR
jgi:hypothetical protein